jgi:peroxidase
MNYHTNRFLLLLLLSCASLVSTTDEVNGEVETKEIKDDLEDLETADTVVTYSTYNQSYNKPLYSDWTTTPGQYTRDSYGGAIIGYERPFNTKSIYYKYLTTKAYSSYTRNCKSPYTGNVVITQTDLNNAFAFALHHIKKYRYAEATNYQKGNYIAAPYTSATARHQAASYIGRRNPKYRKEIEAFFMEGVTIFLTKYKCLNPLQTNTYLPDLQLPGLVATGYVDAKCRYSYGAKVPYSESCARFENHPWRTIDGTCNNPYHKYWGRSNVCHLSLLPKAYNDGVAQPRTKSALDYSDLPSPRIVANELHHPFNSRAYYTTMKMQWGQWINHDITNTPTVQASYNGMIECCNSGYNGPKNSECFPILLPKNDYQAKYNRTCMNFVRSTPCPLCVAGPRQQMNSITSFLDGSGVYGATDDDARRLRLYDKGLLKFSLDSLNYPILPVTNNPWAGQCSSKNGLCFDAGDNRVNQHPGLMVIHVIWLRQHNRIARKLWQLFPTWSDELIYQTARSIVIAQIQLISYKEYMPIVLGKEHMDYYGLTEQPGYTYWNKNTDPTTWNEYAVATCRFGHSQIPNWYSFITGQGYAGNYTGGYKNQGYYLRDNYFNPQHTLYGKTDDQIRGLTWDHSMTSDPWIEKDVRDYLYRDANNPGLDLAAINIQRGRDHGIPGYINYLKYCFNVDIYKWNDLSRFIPYYQLQKLKYLYKSPEDIDLFSGSMSERHMTDADVGPTIGCINGIQWHHTKFGDKWFYSHKHRFGFTPQQLHSIRQTTLTSVLCLNTYIDRLQKWAFFPKSSYNPLINCKTVYDVNLSLWAKPY